MTRTRKRSPRFSDYIKKASFFYRKDQTKAIIMAGQKENAHEIAPMALVASAIINLDEFITKE